MVYLTRRERFSAAHKLWVNDWSEEKNFDVFGKCANPNFHGHNYVLFVTIKGKPHPITGFLLDAKALSKIIKETVIEKVDHKNLNLDVDFIPKTVQPTTENLAYLFWQELAPRIPRGELHCIKIIETENIYVEYYGE